jgi:hypothetical protein
MNDQEFFVLCNITTIIIIPKGVRNFLISLNDTVIEIFRQNNNVKKVQLPCFHNLFKFFRYIFNHLNERSVSYIVIFVEYILPEL